VLTHAPRQAAAWLIFDVGQRTMKALPLLMIAAALLLVGCSDDDLLRASVEKEMHASLSVGDTRDKIERTLNEKKMPFSFNQFEHRYETGVDPKEKRRVKRVITVDIYVDGSDRLTRFEVRNTYTYL
jgi:hypothetical protein